MSWFKEIAFQTWCRKVQDMGFFREVWTCGFLYCSDFRKIFVWKISVLV